MNALGVLVVLAMVLLFVASSWRIGRMSNRIFSLAERELERKLKEAATGDEKPPTAPAMFRCSHCGSTNTTGTECPNCGARLA